MQSMSKDLEEGEKALPGDYYSTFRKQRCYVSLKRIFIFPVIALIVLSSFLISTSLLAREDEKEKDSSGDEDELIVLDPIMVVGETHLSERELENPTKFMTVIDTRESSSRVSTTSEVLDKSVGVQINRYGGMGTFATVSIRGANPNQVQVYLDGVPMNRAMTGVTNIEDLPLDNIEFIEVYRGFVPADFGQAGIGGAINLVTRKNMEETYSASASYGSFETYKLMALGAGPAGPVNVLGFIEYAKSRGDYDYRNDNGTPLNKDDDFIAVRKNNDFSSLDFTFNISYKQGQWELSTVGTGHYKEQGLPGLQRSQAEETRLTTQRGTVTVNARNRHLLSGHLDLLLAADGVWESQVYDDPAGELGTGGARKNENDMDTAGTRMRAVWSNDDNSLLVTGFCEYRIENYLGIEHEPHHYEGDRQSRTLFAYTLQGEWTGLENKLTLQLMHRQEHYENRFHGDPHFDWSSAAGDDEDTYNFSSPSAGIIYRVFESLHVKANAGRYYRVPTFYEMFGDSGVAIGNTDLEPEKGINYDVGGVYQYSGDGFIRSFYLEYAYFHSEVDDMIIFFQNSQRTIKAANIGGALIWGHEFSMSLKLDNRINVSGNYTFQSAVDKGEVSYWRDNALPMRPMHEAYAKLEYQPVPSVKLWSDYTYMSENYWDRANLYQVEPRRIVNAGVMVERQYNEAAWTFGLEGKNLGDNRVSDVAGYPMPGKSVFATVRARY